MKRTTLLLTASVGLVAMSGCTNEELARAAIGRFFHEKNVGKAMDVVECESNFDPNAVSPDNQNHGLFQINNVHRTSFARVTGQSWAMRYDAFWNTLFAKWLYDQSGWRPWTCQP